MKWYWLIIIALLGILVIAGGIKLLTHYYTILGIVVILSGLSDLVACIFIFAKKLLFIQYIKGDFE